MSFKPHLTKDLVNLGDIVQPKAIMSDPLESSENIFKKQSTKGSFSIYQVNKTNFEETFRPQDVISCVNTQLKAYQVADSIKTKNKQISKKFLTCNRSSFLNVTKLPIYVQTPKQDIKFDTQGVTDSQLRNIIETAEILEAHRGMTQEFETDFVQNTTEYEPHNLISEKDSATNITNDDFDAYNDGINNLVLYNIENKGINNRIDPKTIDSLNSGSNLGNENSIHKKIQGINKDISLNSIETTEDTNIVASQILTSKIVKRKKTNIVSDYEEIKDDGNRNDNLIHSVINDDLSDIITEGYCINGDLYGVTSKYNDNNGKDNDKDNNISIVISNNEFPGSQILNTKVSRKRENSGKEFHKADTQIAISTQMLNQFAETQNDETDRPTSPIFPTNVLKQPLNASPLIFNLDKFEQFESIANPIIETFDFETAKHVINSQILDKELHIQINDVNLQKREVLNTTVNKFTIESINTKPIERDKTNAKDILNQGGDTTSEKSTRNKLSTNNLRDEILFSSDEECTNTHEQDLPFTCALETSFYDQDVLDKTVYVGFQTASNKSIQVLADSFAKAKSLLNDVISDDITVTDLVNNINHNTSIEKSKMDGIEEAKPDLLANEVNNSSDKDRIIKDIVTDSHLLTSNKEMNQEPKLSEANADKFVGFKTANNKNIILSENLMVRYKKVFQDIDLNDEFKYTDTALLNNVDVSEIKKKNEPCKNNKSGNCNTTSDILQGIDDKILQEFENIEMSLEDNKNENIKNVSEKYGNVDEFNHLTDKGSKKDGGQHELINPETEFNLFVNKTNSKMNIGEIKLHGFKTASNKNINISKTAWAKSKSVFENIDEISNTTLKHKDETLKLATTAGEAVDTSLPSTSTDFIGFRTANNNDSTKLLNKTTKDYMKTSLVEENKNVNYVNKTKDFIDNQFIVPKAITNKHIETSNDKEIMSNTYLDYNGLKYPQQIENEHEIVCRTTKQADVVNKSIVDNIEITYDEMAANNPISPEFNGFKTASNKIIKVSQEILFKTRNIFKDIDSIDFKDLNRNKKEYPDLGTNVTCNERHNNVERDKKIPDTKCQNSMTHNNKCNKISPKAIIKPKQALQSIENRLENKMNDQNPLHNEFENFNDKWEVRAISPVFKSFQSGNNKAVTVPDKSLKKSKELFKDFDREISINMPITGFVGFQTASNKTVTISEKALENSKKIFKDIDDINTDVNNLKLKPLYPKEIYQNDDIENIEVLINNNKPQNARHRNFDCKNKISDANKFGNSNDNSENRFTSQVFKGFQTGNNKAISVSDKALKKSKELFKDLDKEICTNNPITGFVGFQTASNKKVTISEKSLENSKKIFKDIDDINTDGNILKSKPLYPKEIYQNDDIDSIEILINNNTSQNAKRHNFEWQNKISDANEIVNSNDNLENRSTSPVFRGFQTGNNKAVAVSDNALKKSKELFKDLDEKISVIMPITGFVGFQTASNKKVTISEKALENSKKIFKDIDDINSDCNNLKSKPLYPKEIYQNVDIETLIDKNTEIEPTFKGFHTASSRPVSISKNALEKSKKFLQDLENTNRGKADYIKFQTGNLEVSKRTVTENKKEIDLDIQKNNTFKGFQTGNNKTIIVTNEALAKSKRLFSEIDDQINEHLNKKDKKEISNIDDNNILIDTQIINNFDQSLNTEDFRFDSPERSKRSGSPILSCPRIKKRKKFETPYNLNTIKPIIKSKPIIKQPKILYRHDYKKDKKYRLKDIKDITKDKDSKIDSYILQFKYENLLDFQFNKERNELSDEVITIDLLKDDFINSVNLKLVPDGWVDNHLKLILWKLISYEIKFKIMFCTVKNVMEQLKYRYDRELYNAERPALRKILEKDDVPGKTLVLCVVEIFSDGVKTSSVTKTSNVELLLTDGWYCIQCTIDKMLMELVCNKKIIVGTKLVTCGAELLGCDQGVSPWEDTSAVRLKIFGNSTRRARWDAKLGYHGNNTILSQLSSVKVLGGKVSKLRVFVTRVYPALYVEKFDDGSTVTRSERLEILHHMKMESDRQIIMEKICEEVEKEFIDQESEDSEGMSDTCKRTCMETGSQIAKLMKRSKDPLEFTAQLSHTQTRLLEDHTSKNRDRLIQEMQVRVREKIDKAGVCVNRNVVCLLKIRIAGLRLSGDKVEIIKGMMSIWKPTDSVRDIIKEGAWIDIMNVVPTALRLGEIQISAGRQSIFSTSKFKPIEKFKPYTNLLHRKCYTIKDLAQNPTILTDYNEIDTIGLIFLIDPAIDLFDPAKQSFQNIYLSDADCNIICVHFWGGLKKFGFQNILDTGQIVFCGNLQKRAGNTRKNIPQFRVTELSYFTQTPRNEDAKQILEELNKKILTLNRKEHCEKCILLKNNYSVFKQNNENVSPCRGINNSDINLSRNQIFIDSPLVRAKQDIFTFSGIDFESTFRQDTQLSLEVLKRKRKVNEKIAKLEMYGEPPPLTNLNIINTSKKASSSYKSPLISDNIKKSHLTPNNIHDTPKSIQNSNSSLKNDSDVCENVASVKRSPRNCGIDRSIAMNRTYVKGLNPVKINFDVPNDNIDPFAEEFDVSPPLSLDDYSL